MQMSQQDMDWLKAEWKEINLAIMTKQQELEKAIEAKEAPDVIKRIRDEEKRLVKREEDMWSILQGRLASPPGSFLAA